MPEGGKMTGGGNITDSDYSLVHLRGGKHIAQWSRLLHRVRGTNASSSLDSNNYMLLDNLEPWGLFMTNGGN